MSPTDTAAPAANTLLTEIGAFTLAVSNSATEALNSLGLPAGD